MNNTFLKVFSFVITIGLLLNGCSSSKDLSISKATYGSYEIEESIEKSSEMEAFLATYKEALEEEMNEVVGYAPFDMPRAQPESLLGNFVADLILHQGKTYYNKPVDIAIVNIGGLRVPNIPEGELTKGDIFELMPFDNFLVIMELDAQTLIKLGEVIADWNGWPVAGMELEINNRKLESLKINGEAPVADKIYTVVLSDFLADGGDRLPFLVDLPRENLGVLFRDAIFDYLKYLKESDKPITSKLDGRVKYVQ